MVKLSNEYLCQSPRLVTMNRCPTSSKKMGKFPGLCCISNQAMRKSGRIVQELLLPSEDVSLATQRERMGCYLRKDQAMMIKNLPYQNASEQLFLLAEG